MIGLVDLDLQQSESIFLRPPNLEIMKLATYYQAEENHFCRLINLDETELTGYDKIYMFSEQDERPQIPEAFLQASNVILGGTAFTNGIYQPFQNEIIDYTIARPQIYKTFLSEKAMIGIKPKVIMDFLDNSYYRMYAGHNKLPIPPIWPGKRVFIYDRDFFVPDWTKIIDEILRRKPSSIQPIHPIYCKTVNNFFTLRQYDKISKAASIILDFNIPLSETPILMKKYKNKFLADIKKTSNIYLTLGGTFQSTLQYQRDFIYKLNLLYIYWSNFIPIKIKYIPPKIGYNDPLGHLSQLIETWTTGETNQTKSIADRIHRKSKEKTLEQIERDELVRRFPSTKTLFFQTRETIEKGGFWKYGY